MWNLIGAEILLTLLLLIITITNIFFLTGVKAFDDCCCVDKISSTQHAHEVRIELCDLYSGRAMHFVGKKQERGERPERKDKKKLSVTAKKGHHLERSCLLGSVGGHIVFYANTATIRCGWFTVSSYLEQPINTNQSHWWSSMVGKNSKRRTRTADISDLNCHLITIRFEIGHHAALKDLSLPPLRLSDIL